MLEACFGWRRLAPTAQRKVRGDAAVDQLGRLMDESEFVSFFSVYVRVGSYQASGGVYELFTIDWQE